jgi:hypothetical protein
MPEPPTTLSLPPAIDGTHKNDTRPCKKKATFVPIILKTQQNIYSQKHADFIEERTKKRRENREL